MSVRNGISSAASLLGGEIIPELGGAQRSLAHDYLTASSQTIGGCRRTVCTLYSCSPGPSPRGRCSHLCPVQMSPQVRSGPQIGRMGSVPPSPPFSESRSEVFCRFIGVGCSGAYRNHFSPPGPVQSSRSGFLRRRIHRRTEQSPWAWRPGRLRDTDEFHSFHLLQLRAVGGHGATGPWGHGARGQGAGGIISAYSP